METIFYNYSNEKFTWTWDGRPYSFEPGVIVRDFLTSPDGTGQVVMTRGMAEMFAIHLADKVMNNLGIDPGRLEKKSELVKKALVPPRPESTQTPEPTPKEPVSDSAMTMPEPDTTGAPCDECEFIAKNSVGLKRHKTVHKTNE